MVKLANEEKKKLSISPKLSFTLKIIVFTAVAVVLLTASARNFKKADDYNRLAKQVSAQADSYKAQAEEESNIISGIGFYDYCEKVAREQYGYAKPGEYVLHDSSFGK